MIRLGTLVVVDVLVLIDRLVIGPLRVSVLIADGPRVATVHVGEVSRTVVDISLVLIEDVVVDIVNVVVEVIVDVVIEGVVVLVLVIPVVLVVTEVTMAVIRFVVDFDILVVAVVELLGVVVLPLVCVVLLMLAVVVVDVVVVVIVVGVVVLVLVATVVGVDDVLRCPAVMMGVVTSAALRSKPSAFPRPPVVALCAWLLFLVVRSGNGVGGAVVRGRMGSRNFEPHSVRKCNSRNCCDILSASLARNAWN